MSVFTNIFLFQNLSGVGFSWHPVQLFY